MAVVAMLIVLDKVIKAKCNTDYTQQEGCVNQTGIWDTNQFLERSQNFFFFKESQEANIFLLI